MDEEFEDLFSTWTMCPDLKTLRLMDAPRFALPKERMNGLMWAFWEKWLGRWKERGVVFEGPGGVVIDWPEGGVVVAPMRSGEEGNGGGGGEYDEDEDEEEEEEEAYSDDSGEDYSDEEEEE